MSLTGILSRRTFVAGAVTATGGLSLGMSLPFGKSAAAAPGAGPGPELNAWVVIEPDERVIIRIARSEMGQGTLTGLAQLVAEELECDWANVATEYPSPAQNLKRKRVWGDMGTGGSRGIRTSVDYVMRGGAAARQMLLQAAADQWGVRAGELTVAKGIVTHAASNRSVSYGKLAAAAAKLTPPDPATLTLKNPKDWKIAGQPVKRLDTSGKLDGSQVYGIDLKLPGLLVASIRDCPIQGGKIKSFDAAKAKSMAGVKHVLQVGDGAVAVVADTWWRANQALAAVTVVYEDNPNAQVSSDSIAAVLKAGLEATENIAVGNKAGDATAAIAGAARKIEAVYATPNLHHVTMEPMNCTARWTAERCEIWVPTQNGDASLAACAEAAGLKPEQCEVNKLHLGGGFGRRGKQDYVTKAVLLAKQIPDVPIKLVWSREEDMRQGWFRPVSRCKLQAGLDDKGDIVGLTMRIAGQSILNTVAPQRMENGVDWITFQGLFPKDGPRAKEAGLGYAFPNLTIDYAMRNFHYRPGFWRGVNNNQNALYLECFIDEIAFETKQDPLALRRKLLASSPKHLGVLEAVAKHVGWESSKPPEGQYRGIAQMMGYGSYVAAVAEVSVSGEGKLKVHRIVLGTDCGHIVNPDQVEAQIVGSVAYGLSANWLEQATFENGVLKQQNLDTYEILTLADFPKVEAVMVPSGDFWGGVGEPTIMVVAPAVLNAIHAATGKRIRALPIKNTKLA